MNLQKPLQVSIGKLLRPSSKTNYRSNIKTVMRRLHHTNLDFLISDVPAVLKFLDDVDSKEGTEKYRARQSSRTYETAIVTYLPLAKTDDPNMSVIVKDQYISIEMKVLKLCSL